MIVKYCEWCDNQFQAKAKYQIYCSAECREEATRQKIAERYITLRRNNDSYKNRSCKSCGTRLSVYNADSLCHVCSINPKEVEQALKEIKGFSNGKFKKDN